MRRDPGLQPSAAVLAQNRTEYDTLLQHYVGLTWATSALEQRERAGCQTELLRLYLTLHPDASCSVTDDFDVILRSSARS
jgi:hypothetical protein